MRFPKGWFKEGHEVHWFGIKWWGGEKDIVKGGVHLHGTGKCEDLYDEKLK